MDQNTLRKLAGLKAINENPDLLKNENFLSRVEEKMEEIAQKFHEIEQFLTSADFKKYVEAHKVLHSADEKAEIDKTVKRILVHLTQAEFDYEVFTNSISEPD
jgi:septation ring formation regulator EzrA